MTLPLEAPAHPPPPIKNVTDEGCVGSTERLRSEAAIPASKHLAALVLYCRQLSLVDIFSAQPGIDRDLTFQLFRSLSRYIECSI